MRSFQVYYGLQKQNKHKPLSNQIVKKKSHDTPPKDRPP